MNNIIVSPSIASANPLQLACEVEKAINNGVKDIHIDIEDGNFVPNITFGLKTIRALRGRTNIPFSFHLMTNNQEQWLTDVSKFNPSIVFGHFEALAYPKAFIGLAKNLGVRCGLAFNPRTSVDDAEYLIEDLDGILLLSSEPDKMGEFFLPFILNKAEKIRKMSNEIELWVDGGITRQMFSEFESRNITHVVLGREFFGNNS